MTFHKDYLKVPFSHKFRIGVMGSAQGPSIIQKKNSKLAEEVGSYIAEKAQILINGGCPGLPNDAAIAAKKSGGFVIGVSPAFSRREHIERYFSPIDSYDLMLYTGAGLMERDILNIRFSDVVIILGGGIGTLNEFTIAFDEGRYVGVLISTEGIASHLEDIIEKCNREAGGRIFFEKDPKVLIDKLLHALENGPKVTTEDERIVNKYTFLV